MKLITLLGVAALCATVSASSATSTVSVSVDLTNTTA